MSDSRQFFTDMMSGDRKEQMKSSERVFEEKLVRVLLTRFKLECRKEMETIWQRAFGYISLRLRVFNELFPTFPFTLGASNLCGLPIIRGGRVVATTPPFYKLHTDVHAAEPARYKDFARVPYVAAYARFVESLGRTADIRPVCLVFPRMGTNGMCLHNDQSERHWTHGLCEVYKGAEDHKLYKLKFDTLIAAIYANGRGWRPD